MKKNLKNISLKNKILKKKNVKAYILTGLTASVAAAPIIASTSYSVNKVSYSFDGKQFSSKNSVLNYVKNNSQKTTNYIEGYDSQWKISINGSVKTFSNSQELRQTVYDQYIKEQLVRTNVDLTQFEGPNGSVDLTDDIWNNIYDASAQSARVYQGANDVAYSDEKSAYDSYYNVKSAYYFNNIYFNTKDELRTYLLEQYLPNNKSENSQNTIILQGPNGVKSSPINLNDANSLNQISSFIVNNAKKILSYTNSKTGEQYTLTKNNFNSHLVDVTMQDLDYIHVQSNQGQSRYVVDNDVTDDANLIGPYFYNGTLDVGAFTNKKMWKKVNGVTNSVYVQSKIDSMIGSFFSSVINDDSSLILSDAEQSGNDPALFRTILTDSNGDQYDQEFLRELKKLSPELYEAVNEVNLTLLKGKKYNTFNKIPILYSFLMQRAISWGLGQDVVNLIVDYFTNVCNFIQDTIELVVMDDSLLLSKDGKTKFNVVDFFQIGNPEYDLNTSTEYYLNQLKTNYPSLVAAMNTYISAQNNIGTMAGLIPYSGVDNSYLVEYKVCDLDLLEKIDSKLQNIYNVFSSLNYDSDMLVLYIKNSGREDVKAIQSLPQDQWKEAFTKLTCKHSAVDLNTLLSSIGANNNQYHSLAKAMLNLEIKTYLSTGRIVDYGYLSKIYSSNEKYDKLGQFINFVSNNSDLDTYRVYMAVLVDKRMSTNIINSQTMANPTAFARALSQVIFLGLGTVSLVGNSVSKIYGGNTNSFGTSQASNITTISTSRQASGSNTWYSASGDDTSTIKTPTENPLYKLFLTNDENLTSTTKNRVSTRGLNVKIDPNDPNVSKKIDILKNGSQFTIPKDRTSVLVDHFEHMSITDVNQIVAVTSDGTKHSVKKVYLDEAGLEVTNVDKVAVAANPIDVASVSNAANFDQIDTLVDDMTAKLSSTSSTTTGIESSLTSKLQAEYNTLKSECPQRHDYFTDEQYQKALKSWETKYNEVKTQLEFSKISDEGGFSFPLRQNFDSDLAYEKAYSDWQTNIKKLIQSNSNGELNSILSSLEDYPLRKDFTSDADFQKACAEYKANYDKIMKSNFPDYDTSWVGGTKPNSSTNDGPSSGGSSNNSSSGGGSDISSKPGSGGSSTSIDLTTPGSNDSNNFTRPNRDNFESDAAYFKALDKWSENMKNFETTGLNGLSQELKDDFFKNIGRKPEMTDFDSLADYWNEFWKYEASRDEWIRKNMPNNTGVWQGATTNTPHTWYGISSSSDSADGDTSSKPSKPSVDGDTSSKPSKPSVDGDTSSKPSKPSKPSVDGDTSSKPSKPSVDGDTSSKPSKPSSTTNLDETVKNKKISASEKLKSWWSGSSKFAKIKDTITTVASYALEIFATAFAVMEIAFFVIDLLKVTKTQDFYEYTTADGTNFYWDGGLTVSRFMGLSVAQEKGIDDMKLLTPIQVTLPQTEEYYYFNSVKYYSTDELKKAELTYVFNGGSFARNTNFQVSYTLGDDATSNYNDKADSIDKLVEKIFEDLNIGYNEYGDPIVSTINKDSDYIASTYNSIGNGIIIDNNKDNYVSITDNIVNNIRPTNIVKLPDTKNGVSNGKTSSFVFPGNYWNNSTKTVVYQDAEEFNNYLVDNSANDLKDSSASVQWYSQDSFANPNASDAQNKSLSNLRELFEQSFTINSKTVLTRNQVGLSYSQMISDNTLKPLYIVQLSKNQSPVYFADEAKATQYLMNMLNLTKVSSTTKVTSYYFNGMYFANEEILTQWVMSQI